MAQVKKRTNSNEIVARTTLLIIVLLVIVGYLYVNQHSLISASFGNGNYVERPGTAFVVNLVIENRGSGADSAQINYNIPPQFLQVTPCNKGISLPSGNYTDYCSLNPTYLVMSGQTYNITAQVSVPNSGSSQAYATISIQ